MNVYVVYVGENPKTSGYEYAVFDSKESNPRRYIINLELLGTAYRNAVLKKSPLKPPASKPVMIHEGGFVDQGPNYLALNDI
jgi:hypothetical protein